MATAEAVLRLGGWTDQLGPIYFVEHVRPETNAGLAVAVGWVRDLRQTGTVDIPVPAVEVGRRLGSDLLGFGYVRTASVISGLAIESVPFPDPPPVCKHCLQSAEIMRERRQAAATEAPPPPER